MAVLVAVLLCGNAVSLVSLFASKQQTRHYNEASDTAQKIYAELQREIDTWKNILIYRNQFAEYNENYYRLSQKSQNIQNLLFDLKLTLSENSDLVAEIEQARERHSALSSKYSALLSEMQKGLSDPAERVRADETQTGRDFERIAHDIAVLCEREINRIDAIYLATVIASIIFISILSVYLFWRIVMTNREAQQKFIMIAAKLNSYLPPQLVNSIMKDAVSTDTPSDKKYITVCFIDLAGFTSFSEKTSPDILKEVLNRYMTDMAMIAQAWGGMIDKFIGDGIMILFGAFDDEQPADQAAQCVNMAVAMQHHIQTLRDEWHNGGIECRLLLRIGIHSGEAVVGSFGPPDRRSFTALGSTVNMAARLEKVCIPGKVTISSTVRASVCATMPCVKRGRMMLKGIASQTEIYEVDIP